MQLASRKAKISAVAGCVDRTASIWRTASDFE